MNQRVADNSFGSLLLWHRTHRGLTQRGLSAALRERGATIGPSSITRMETGQREPTLSEAFALSRYLGFDLVDVADGEHLTFWGHRDAAQSALLEARAALVRCFNEANTTRVIWDHWEDDHVMPRESIGLPNTWLDTEEMTHTYLGEQTPTVSLNGDAEAQLYERVKAAVCRIDVEWGDRASS